MPGKKKDTLPDRIFLVSGGSGASGKLILHTALAQFPGRFAEIANCPHVRTAAEAEEIAGKARSAGSPIVHTLVNAEIRAHLVRICRKLGVEQIDLMGDLLTMLSVMLREKPACKPGLYMELNREYFKRAEAIEFTIAHDDGQKPEDLKSAEIVVAAISRVGKTPLSIYLSTLGWKVANIPLVKGAPVPEELMEVEKGRGFGLIIEPERVVAHRKMRARSLGNVDMSAYTDIAGIAAELEFARGVYEKAGFTTVDITDKPIESVAEVIVDLVVKRFGR